MFQPDIYRQRRQRLAALLPDSLLLLLGNVDSPMNYRDNIFPFVQDSSFRYFFGLNEPGLAGIIDTASGDTTLAAITAALSYSLSPGHSVGDRSSPAPCAIPAQVWAWRRSVPVITASKRSPRSAQ